MHLGQTRNSRSTATDTRRLLISLNRYVGGGALGVPKPNTADRLDTKGGSNGHTPILFRMIAFSNS